MILQLWIKVCKMIKIKARMDMHIPGLN